MGTDASTVGMAQRRSSALVNLSARGGTAAIGRVAGSRAVVGLQCSVGGGRREKAEVGKRGKGRCTYYRIAPGRSSVLV